MKKSTQIIGKTKQILLIPETALEKHCFKIIIKNKSLYGLEESLNILLGDLKKYVIEIDFLPEQSFPFIDICFDVQL